ncbi:hypothetical protein AWB78_05953 [Caballeronia calidae]|uniref:Uncharacterized protein n=1 Tax=Caballeronia calidae TaxID=1777139 RepID=A0A158E143_9BURK|nr:hypothetical protein [Caballeronia calidae]SAL00483.1 hypothetical protein AWB78_05953 [Caballeronia calidae]
MNTRTPVVSGFVSRLTQHGFAPVQKYLLHGYRWLAVILLGTVLLSAACYGIVTITYLVNTNWVAPVVLSKSDPKVAALAGQIFTAKQNRDTMREELDSADQARKLLQTQHDWLKGIIARYESSLGAEKDADAAFNGRLKQLVKEKRVVDARTAEVVASNKKAATAIDQELDAGLITANTAINARAQLVATEAALNTGKIGTATLDNQISQLTRGVHSLQGGNTSPEAMQSLAQVSLLKQELAETDLKLVQLNADVSAKSKQVVEVDALLRSLKGSPYYMAAYGEKDLHRFAFVPYDNEDASRVGAPVFACKLQIVWCSKVGVVKAITKDEERAQHPLFNTQIRGVLVELDLEDEKAAKSQTLFMSHSPFYIL